MNDTASSNDPRLYAIPDIHGHAKGEHKAFSDERPIPLSARMLFLWFYHACRRGWPRFLMVSDHMNYLTFEDPAAINLVRRALKLAQAGDLYGAAETASVEVGHAAVVSEGLRRGMRYSIGAEVDNDPRSRPDAQNIVDAMKPDGMIRSVHFLTIDHPTHGPNWNWPFDNPEFADVYEIVGTDKTWELYMLTLLDAVERLPGNILGHFYVPAIFGHWPDDATLERYEDQIVDACEARGMAIEFNTRFLYRDHSAEAKARYLAAHRRLLTKCKAKNVGIAVGSDAHSPKDQGRGFETVLALLDECEINELIFPIAGRLARVALRVERKVEAVPEPISEERRAARKARPVETSSREEVVTAPAIDQPVPTPASPKSRPRPKRGKAKTSESGADANAIVAEPPSDVSEGVSSEPLQVGEAAARAAQLVDVTGVAALGEALELAATAEQLLEAQGADAELGEAEVAGGELVEADAAADESLEAEDAAAELVEADAAAKELVEAVVAADQLVEADVAADELVEADVAADQLVEADVAADLLVEADVAADELVEADAAADELVETEAATEGLVQAEAAAERRVEAEAEAAADRRVEAEAEAAGDELAEAEAEAASDELVEIVVAAATEPARIVVLTDPVIDDPLGEIVTEAELEPIVVEVIPGPVAAEPAALDFDDSELDDQDTDDATIANAEAALVVNEAALVADEAVFVAVEPATSWPANGTDATRGSVRKPRAKRASTKPKAAATKAKAAPAKAKAGTKKAAKAAPKPAQKKSPAKKAPAKRAAAKKVAAKKGPAKPAAAKPAAAKKTPGQKVAVRTSGGKKSAAKKSAAKKASPKKPAQRRR